MNLLVFDVTIVHLKMVCLLQKVRKFFLNITEVA